MHVIPSSFFLISPQGDQYMILGAGEDTPLSDNMSDGKVPVYSPIFERHLRSLIAWKS